MKYSIKELIEEAPQDIRKDFTYRTYPLNTYLFPVPGQADFLYIIDSGIVEVIKESYNGAVISVNTFTEGALLGEIELFCPDLESYKVRSKTDCRLLNISKETAFQWMQKDFRVTYFICESMGRRLYYTSNDMSRIAMLPLKQRILGCIYTQYRAGTLPSFTKDILVEQTCAPLRSVNRILRDCIDSGLIDYRKKRFCVLDEKALEPYGKEYDI